MTPRGTTSLWLDGVAAPADPQPPASRYDVVVVGAGLTGMVTAVLLARSGCSVGVLEARFVGAGTTGHTTAKVSLLQGTKLSELSKKQPGELVRAYVQGNLEGQAWLRHYCVEHGLAHQIRPAFTYAATAQARASAEAELEACLAAELPARWDDDLALPYETRGGVRLDGQLQISPMEVLAALTQEFRTRGGRLLTGVRVTSVDRTSPGLAVETTAGPTAAETVVLATGTPVLDRGLFFSRIEPRRSYVAAFRVPGPLPQGMYLSADSPTRSLRTVPTDQGELLLVGGNGHVVGREDDTTGQMDDLTRWTVEWFPGAERTHAWSAQDYHPTDGLPFVGALTPTNDAVLVATGYDKWGMATGTAAGLALSAHILGGHMEWSEALRPWTRHELSGAPGAAVLNAGVGARWVGDRARHLLSASDDPAEGAGIVRRNGLSFEAVCRVDGELHTQSAVCPHLAGIVSWNEFEKSWDCPLHGSRFAADGTLLEGPATRGLDQVSP